MLSRPIGGAILTALLVSTGLPVGAQTSVFDAPGSETAAGNFYQAGELGAAVDAPAVSESREPIDQSLPATEAVTRDTGTVSTAGFINFGYLQNNNVTPYLHYEALTHIAPPFVNFDTNGNLTNPGTFTSRDVNLRVGGSADRAGTKIIMCVRNNGFNEAILASVMQSPAKQDTLVAAVAQLVKNDPYCQGVNFDFEFQWTGATRDGITQFLQKMRAALPQPYEVSVYVHAIYSSTYWNVPAIINNVDYLLYSTYDWATGNTAHAPSDFNNCVPHIVTYLNAGVPPEKLVLTWASYGRRWTGVTAYNQNNGGAGDDSMGFFNGLYDTTLRQSNGGPFTSNYVTGDEIGWYTYSSGATNYVTVRETPESIEYKISSALSFPGNNGQHAGVRLGGVGWWSLMWVSDYYNGFQMYDPLANAAVSRAPYYRHIDLLAQEILKNPAQESFVLESFENTNSHWRDPNEAPSTSGDTDNNSSFARVAAPAGAGRPAGTVNAGRLVFDFESGSGNRVFLRHELLNNDVETAVTDKNAALALISKNSRIRGSYYVASSYTGRNLRLALVDSQGEVEVSQPTALPATAGWHTFEWDINDPAQAVGWTTGEVALRNGDGVVETAGPGARDISFAGFIVEGGGAGSGTIYFDDVTYEDHAPQDKKYVINEFRYADSGAEFVEISGPAGPFPGDMQLISYNSADGSVFKSTPLSSYSIPASGLFVVGDTGVPGASGSTGVRPASWTGDDIPNTAPSGLQLYGSSSGYVYDSVVYRAHGGIQDLARTSTRRVAKEGPGWTGETGNGTAGNGQILTMGRMPDGADTNWNEADLSLMPPTPGQPNGASGLMGETINFSSVPPAAFQTYQSLKLVNPTGAGLSASSPGDTSVLRCVDTAGGGVVAYFGDALMGTGTGLEVSGKLFIPAVSHPAQAVAIGFCGTQGSTFFSASPAGNGYENGYWLIYENSTNDLADGQSNHPQQFEFLMASNNRQDSEIARPLGLRKTAAQVSAATGTWANFRLRIDPMATPGDQLVAQINNVDIYRGVIPTGGRTTGAFMVGFREAQGGAVLANEGTWIDDLLIAPANAASGISDYQLY